MKLNIHPAQSRGAADHGWLKSRHSFSFGSYYDAKKMGFGKLRVLNDDVVQAQKGFGTHPHKNMEIVSIPLAGSLAHKDSMANAQVIQTGEVQIMSAGTGVSHSEFNPSETEPVNFLQIWVLPKRLNIEPRYEQKTIAPLQKGEWTCLVSPNQNSPTGVWINQDAYFSMAEIEPGTPLNYPNHLIDSALYLFVLDGVILLDGKELKTRDGAEISHFHNLSITALSSARVLAIETPL